MPAEENPMSEERCVQPLKRIRLALKAGATAGDMGVPLPSAEIDYIFGIGSGGLTPFECLLNGRAENEAVAFRVAASEAGLFFGHFFPALPNTAFGRLFDGRDEVHFDVRIMAVETPPPREIIKAMADLTAHGHGCDCGCGCS